MVAAKLINIDAKGRQRIDRYELIGEIASGGMATVFLARLTGMGGFQRFVAMKRLHPHLAKEQEFVEMFLDEARLAAGIHHPNVVPIIEVGANPSGYYLIMEYIEGDTLARLLARGASARSRLPHNVGMRIVLDMLAGLNAAHDLRSETGELIGLVHRDVSPQNVLVGVDGISRITDFGVARATSRLSETRVGQLKGKIAYMAPEQATGADINRRADIFSAGIVAWEVLAARRLFKAENEAATLSRVITEPIPKLSDVARGVSSKLSDVIMRALERDPEKRYATCVQFADAIEQAAEQIASQRELASYVTEVIGQEIALQREAVRGWLAQSEPSQNFAPAQQKPASSVSAAAMSLPGVEPSAPASYSTSTELSGMRSSKKPLVFATLLVLASIAGAFAYFVYEIKPDLAFGTRTRDLAGSRPSSAAPASVAPDAPKPARPADTLEVTTPESLPTEAPATASVQNSPNEPAPPAATTQTAPRPVRARSKPSRSKGPSDRVDLSNPYR